MSCVISSWNNKQSDKFSFGSNNDSLLNKKQPDMELKTILVRENDGKRFEVTCLAHWSDIKADDGETDTVKWVGGNYFVSATKGFGYRT